MLLSSFGSEKLEAGIDEVGRGCLAGPVVAAAVILPSDYQHPELKDSKQLSEKKRDRISEKVRQDAIAWGIGQADNREIDKINIAQASYLAMHRALDSLIVAPELLLVDGKYFNSYKSLPHHCIVKGDNIYLSIAAASVLAKTHRDQLMRGLAEDYPDYGWDTNVGYPTKTHREGLLRHGKTPYHRNSFRLINDFNELSF